jgi:hypothetical protein
VWVFSISLAVTLITFLIHDVKLNEEIKKLSAADTPEITLDNIRFERDMFDSLWKINIPSLERQKEVVKILSIDISREFPNGDIWELNGKSGEFVERSEIATFNEISGHIIFDGQTLEIYAPHVSWEKSGDLVVISKGIRINGEYSSLSADSAKVEDGNMVTIERGEIVWNFLSYDLR